MNSTEEYLDRLLREITEGSAENKELTEDSSQEDSIKDDITIGDVSVEDYLTEEVPLKELEPDERTSIDDQLLEDEDIAALLKSMGETNLPPEEVLFAGSTENNDVASMQFDNSFEDSEDNFLDSDIGAMFNEELPANADESFEELAMGEEPLEDVFRVSEEFSPDEEITDDELFKEEITDDDDGHFNEEQSSQVKEVDLLDLLAGMSDDAELSEISELLSKNDNHEIIGQAISNLNEDESKEDFLSLEQHDATEIEETESSDIDKIKKKKGKQKREKKENRPGLFSKLFTALSQEVEEPEEIKHIFAEETARVIAKQGAVENEKILKEMEKESSSKKKKDKNTKEKKIKEKKVKEKRVKEKSISESQPPIKKLPRKKVILIGFLCFSLGVIITLIAFIFPYYSDIKNARAEFEQQNYEKTYELLRGRKLNEEEQLMYDKSVVLLKAERKYDSYQNYMLLGMKLEALNALIQGVRITEVLSDTAARLGVQEEFDAIRNKIISELELAFAVSLEQAQEWLQIEDNQIYSRELDGYVNGTSSGENPEGTTIQQNIQKETPVIIGEEEEFAPTDEGNSEQESDSTSEDQGVDVQESENAENETTGSTGGRSTQNIEELNENVSFDMEGTDGQ